MILSDISNSYITNGDGSEISAVQISAPSNDFTTRAKHALINGEVFIFGGTTNKRKVYLVYKQNHHKLS